MEAQAEYPHRLRTALLINLAAILERCDEQVFAVREGATVAYERVAWKAMLRHLRHLASVC